MEYLHQTFIKFFDYSFQNLLIILFLIPLFEFIVFYCFFFIFIIIILRWLFLNLTLSVRCTANNSLFSLLFWIFITFRINFKIIIWLIIKHGSPAIIFFKVIRLFLKQIIVLLLIIFKGFFKILFNFTIFNENISIFIYFLFQFFLNIWLSYRYFHMNLIISSWDCTCIIWMDRWWRRIAMIMINMSYFQVKCKQKTTVFLVDVQAWQLHCLVMFFHFLETFDCFSQLSIMKVHIVPFWYFLELKVFTKTHLFYYKM